MLRLRKLSDDPRPKTPSPKCANPAFAANEAAFWEGVIDPLTAEVESR
jgi:hypothetical protein